MDEGALERAQILYERSKAKFPFLIPDENNMNGRLTGIESVPESFFVDKNGNIVSDPYVGANSQKEWKKNVDIVTIMLSILMYRPFCKYICPLGAIYSVFAPISVFRYRVDEEKCVGCGICEQICDMGCKPLQNANSLECIRCGKCKQECPTKAITFSCRKSQ